MLILLQANLVAVERRWWLSLGLFALTAICSLYGQMAVVDQATRGQAPDVRVRRLRNLALACLGGAGGAALATVRF